MPRFFFHLREKSKTTRDVEGMELPDVDAVYEEAVESAREIMSQQVLRGERANGQAFVIADECGNTVMTFPFKLAIEH